MQFSIFYLSSWDVCHQPLVWGNGRISRQILYRCGNPIASPYFLQETHSFLRKMIYKWWVFHINSAWLQTCHGKKWWADIHQDTSIMVISYCCLFLKNTQRFLSNCFFFYGSNCSCREGTFFVPIFKPIFMILQSASHTPWEWGSLEIPS